MTRKCAWAGFSYLAALALSAMFRSEFNFIFAAAALGLGIITFCAVRKFRTYAVVCTIFFLLGIGFNTFYTQRCYNNLIKLDGESVIIYGYVKEYDYIGSDTGILTVHGKVNGFKTDIAFFVDHADYRYYDEVSVTGQVEKITDSINFQSEDYYYSKGIFLKGKTAENVERSGENVNPLFCKIREFRDFSFEQIQRICSDEEGAFLGALMCGDKSEMSQSMKTDMYRSGIGHIFAVSGAHLVIVTTLFSAVLSRFIRHRRIMYFLTLAEIWCFAIFAGLSVTVVRAAIMLTISKSGFLFGRKSDCANSLGLCAILLTVGCPYAAISPSFMLSFMSVFALGVIAPAAAAKFSCDKKQNKFINYITACVCVLFFTAPVSAVSFGGVSVAGILSNIILVPLCSLALQLCFVGIIFSGVGIQADVIFRLAGVIVKPVLKLTELIAEIPYSYVTVTHKAVLAVICLTALVPIIALFLRRWENAFLISSTAVICIWMISAGLIRLLDGNVKIAVLPDGNDSIYIVTFGSEAIVMDVGIKGGYNDGLERLLRKNGIICIDAMFISEGEIYTIGTINKDLSVKPDLYFTQGESDTLYENVEYLSDEGYVEICGFEITKLDNGYMFEYGENILLLCGGEICINDEYYDISTEEYPLEIDCDDYKVRRLDYAFD